MKLIELKELLFPFPEDSEVVIEVFDENAPANEDLYDFYVDHVTIREEGEIQAYEIRLCLTKINNYA
jgi:hypothetical protein